MIEKSRIEIRTTEINGEDNTAYWRTPLILESPPHGLAAEVVVSLPEGAKTATVLARDLVDAAVKASILKHPKRRIDENQPERP